MWSFERRFILVWLPLAAISIYLDRIAQTFYISLPLDVPFARVTWAIATEAILAGDIFMFMWRDGARIFPVSLMVIMGVVLAWEFSDQASVFRIFGWLL